MVGGAEPRKEKGRATAKGLSREETGMLGGPEMSHVAEPEGDYSVTAAGMSAGAKSCGALCRVGVGGAVEVWIISGVMERVLTWG